MKIIKKIQKYSFFAKRFIKAKVVQVAGRARSIGFNYEVSSVRETPLSKLPYPTDWTKVFGNKPLTVEIGSGHGEVLDYYFHNEKEAAVGFEWKSRWYRLIKRKIRNVKSALVFKGNAYEVIPLLFGKQTVDRFLLLFPDPWHKERHQKRRPITSEWARSVYPLLKQNGSILVATDWEEYADFIRNHFSKLTDIYEFSEGEYTPEKFNLPKTHYYKKWVVKGRKFVYFLLKKK